MRPLRWQTKNREKLKEQSGGNFNAVGILINTKQFPHTQPIQGGGPHAIHQIIYSNNTYPWAANNNPLLDDHFSELVFQVYLRNKLLTTEGTASAGIGWGAYFQDEFGNVFPYVIQIADSRALGNGNGSETTAHDTGTPFVSVPLLSNTCYATRSPFSASMKNVTPFGRQFFRVHIPRQSFLDAVTALRARNNINFSTDIKKYRLTSINVGTEVNVVGNSNNITTGIAIDNLSVFIGKSPVTATWAPVMLVNGSFEAHRFAPGFNAFVYTPSPTGWTFSGASGVQRDGSAWGATKAPDGDNTAFLPSGTGVGISQNVHFAAPGGYRLSFKAARRAGQIQPISLRLDGIERLFFTPPGNSFSSHSIDFNVATAGSRQISFIATDQSGDKTTFIDNVSIAKIY